MTLWALLMLVGSAGLHVVAHVALKQAHHREAFVWWLLLWGGLLFTPLAWLRWQSVSLVAGGLLVVSAAVEALYFFSIAKAYNTGDLSLVYPLARGSSPLFLALWSTVFLGEALTPGGIGGMGLIAAGLYVINLPGLHAWIAPLQALRLPGPRWALLAGLCISLYTAIDRLGVRYLDPLLYTYLVLWLTWAWLTLPTMRALGWGGLLSEVRSSGWSSLLAGFTTLAAYAIVLVVMQAGTPAGYAGAVREISVVLGAAIGVLWLKERGTRMRLLGAALVALGVAGIKLWG